MVRRNSDIESIMAQKKEIKEQQSFDRTNSELYKELEIINFKELAKSLEDDKREKRSLISKILRSKSTVSPIDNAWKRPPRTQLMLFQKSMKFLLVCGQWLGLNPVIGISDMDISKMRFKFLSFRFFYSLAILSCQTMATVLCVHRLFKKSISITILAFISFYASTTTTTLLFLRIATKWPSLMREISNSLLDRYIDFTVQAKCMNSTGVLLFTAMLEHLLSQSTKISHILRSETRNGTLYEGLLEDTFPWFKELGVPFNVPIGMLLQIINVISTLNWSISDVFIVCISFYLVSILNQINKTIIEADKTTYHPSFWSRVREDYTRATRLVISFDEVISGIILTSFASNLFFICLQLFYVLAHGIQGTTAIGSSPLSGIENMMYFIFSFMFVLGRFLAVSFIAASVHSATLAPASVLYTLPSSAYCSEVQRFLEQIHGSKIALSGLQFFHVTRGLVLSVAGTIVTYELVLLQFNGEV